MMHFDWTNWVYAMIRITDAKNIENKIIPTIPVKSQFQLIPIFSFGLYSVELV